MKPEKAYITEAMSAWFGFFTKRRIQRKDVSPATAYFRM